MDKQTATSTVARQEASPLRHASASGVQDVPQVYNFKDTEPQAIFREVWCGLRTVGPACIKISGYYAGNRRSHPLWEP